MHTRKPIMAALAAAILAGAGASAGAVDLGSLKSLAGDTDLSSAASGSMGNAAGIIEFCVRNNYLGGDAATTVKEGLMAKLGASPEPEQQDADFADGAKGLLKTGDGGQVDLAQFGDMKKSLTEKACASVLDHAKSLL